MTTTPQEPTGDPEVVPSGEPNTNPIESPGPGGDPTVSPDPEINPDPGQDPDSPVPGGDVGP